MGNLLKPLSMPFVKLGAVGQREVGHEVAAIESHGRIQRIKTIGARPLGEMVVRQIRMLKPPLPLD